MKKKQIVIKTPCSVSDAKAYLNEVFHERHWHDAFVRGEKGKLVIEFYDDRQALSVSKAKRS